MDPFAGVNGAGKPQPWQISGLDPLPEEEWQRIRGFVALNDAEINAMLTTVEALFRRGHELVVGTYDYLLHNHETAAILGWDDGAEPTHLAERRRFFTIWLARLLGIDFSTDLARYLFRAGKLHAAHGPRRTHVPPIYVTGSISLVNATFARFIMEEMPGHPQAPLALAGWNKVLTMHLHLMQMGYQAALALDSGDFAVPFVMFGRMRTVTGAQNLPVHVTEGGAVQHALRKFFNYYPQARSEVFDVAWAGGERMDSHGTPWFTVDRQYAVKPMWRVLLNGKDLSFIGGPELALHPGDEVHVFPPGR
jgi:molybdopterin converting factor small subunit